MTGIAEQDPYQKIKKLFDGKKFDEVITYCQKILENDPTNKIALQNIGSAYNVVGAYHDAIKNANKILEINNGDTESLFKLINKFAEYYFLFSVLFVEPKQY